MHYDHQFIDEKDRKIEFDVREDWISAYHEGEKIGEFSMRIVSCQKKGWVGPFPDQEPPDCDENGG